MILLMKNSQAFWNSCINESVKMTPGDEGDGSDGEERVVGRRGKSGDGGRGLKVTI